MFDTAIAYENGHANIKDTCLNVLKGFFACSLLTVVPQRLYSFCVSLQHTFANDLVVALIQNRTATLTSAGIDALDALRADVSLSSLFFIILFGYCTIKVVFANIKRGGILLCQIAVGSLYMFSVPRGYLDGFYQWCKQVVGLCLTAFLQATILIAGLTLFNEHALLGLGLMLSAGEIPRIAGAFGLDTSTRANLSSAVYTAQTAINITKTVAKAAAA